MAGAPAALIAGLLLAASYSGCAVFSHGIENCTQGDTDSYLFGGFLRVPLALGASVMFLLARRSRPFATALVVSLVWLLSLGAALNLVPWAESTVVGPATHAFADYGPYIPYMRPVDPYVPLIYVALLNVVFLSSLVRALWSRGAQPNEVPRRPRE